MAATALTIECRGCGSDLSYSAKDLSLKCPYCGTVALIPKATPDPQTPVSDDSDNPTTPHAISPLSIEISQLVDTVYSYLASGELTPDNLIQNATLTTTERFYVPVFVFHGEYSACWSASFGFDRQEEYITYETRHENGVPYSAAVTNTRTVTDWRPASGIDSGKYVAIAYAGSQYLNTSVSIIDLIERSPDADYVPFNPLYLADIAAEPCSVSLDDAYNGRALPKINQIIDKGVKQHAQGDDQREWYWTSQIDKEYFMVLVPICHAVYQYEDKSYNVWISGTNSSQIVADPLPIDKGRQISIYAGFVPFFVAIIAASVALLLFGVPWPIPLAVITVAALYGYIRQQSILKYSRNLRQSILASKRAAATNTAAMSAADQQALLSAATPPKKPWLLGTGADPTKTPPSAAKIETAPSTAKLETSQIAAKIKTGLITTVLTLIALVIAVFTIFALIAYYTDNQTAPQSAPSVVADQPSAASSAPAASDTSTDQSTAQNTAPSDDQSAAASSAKTAQDTDSTSKSAKKSNSKSTRDHPQYHYDNNGWRYDKATHKLVSAREDGRSDITVK